MKVVWTTPRDRIALIPPQEFKEKLLALYAHADKARNGYITITIETVRKARSVGYKSQNHAINGAIRQIAEYTGEEAEKIKTFLKGKAVRRGYPYKMKSNGDYVYSVFDGKKILKSETEISSVEAGYLIEEIRQEAAELNIRLMGFNDDISY